MAPNLKSFCHLLSFVFLFLQINQHEGTLKKALQLSVIVLIASLDFNYYIYCVTSFPLV